MLNFFNKYNQLSENQFGFRRGKSCIDAVVRLIDKVVEGLECRKSTLSVFLDLSKAFDCVDHKTLLDKLESHGIRGVPLDWLASFLRRRSQFVQISNQSSDLIDLCYGVPQGSILSPVLFLVYVNDIGGSMQKGNIIQYADDTTLCFSDKSLMNLEQNVFLELNNCIQQFNNINLKTNSLKTNFLNFSLSPENVDLVPNVMIEETPIEQVYTSKFLGIHLDQGLTWNFHVDAVCSKLTSGIFALRSLAKYCPPQVLMTAYYGLIYPHLVYGVILWGASAKHNILRVFRLQKKAIRLISKVGIRESCRPLFKKLKVLTVPCIYILETSMFITEKCTLIQGRDVHEYNTRYRNYYRTERHRTTAYKHLPKEAGVHFLNKLPNSIKNSKSKKLFKTRLKTFLVAHAFYSVDEFLALNWETVETSNT